MTIRFGPQREFIIIKGRVFGPVASLTLQLAIDTGATYSVIPPDAAAHIGYDMTSAVGRVRIITGSRSEFTARILLDSLAALATRRHRFPVLVHAIPSEIPVDGLLGLDFFRGQRLMIDFRAGTIHLA